MPTAGTETVDPLAFLARVLMYIPDKGQVTTRCYGWYATRPRGMRRQAEAGDVGTAVPIVPARPLAPAEARRRWAELVWQIFEVDPLVCPLCGGAMRIVTFIMQTAVMIRSSRTGARGPARGVPQPGRPRRATRRTGGSPARRPPDAFARSGPSVGAARCARRAPAWLLEHPEGSGPVAGEIAVPPDDAPGAVEPAPLTAHRRLARRQNPQFLRDRD
ncbi:MAG: transposase [Gemmatimonadales bacterium]|nr:transposase [Gemmatimonadales bacterium]